MKDLQSSIYRGMGDKRQNLPKKIKVLHIRCTEAELAILKEKAAKAKRNLSNWAIVSLLALE